MLKKMNRFSRSASIEAAKQMDRIDPSLLRVRITAPYRVNTEAPDRPKSDARLAVEAQARGLGGNFRQPTRELLLAIGRYR